LGLEGEGLGIFPRTKNTHLPGYILRQILGSKIFPDLPTIFQPQIAKKLTWHPKAGEL